VQKGMLQELLSSKFLKESSPIKCILLFAAGLISMHGGTENIKNLIPHCFRPYRTVKEAFPMLLLFSNVSTDARSEWASRFKWSVFIA
jgi:hypothetical protein